jgi:hypothetical protein
MKVSLSFFWAFKAEMAVMFKLEYAEKRQKRFTGALWGRQV